MRLSWRNQNEKDRSIFLVVLMTFLVFAQTDSLDTGILSDQISKIGDREFLLNDANQKGSVEVVEKDGKKYFKVVNAKIKTSQNIQIETGGKDTYVSFGEVDMSEHERHIKITGDGGEGKTVTVDGQDYKIKHKSEGEDFETKFVLDENGELTDGTKFKTQAGVFTLNGYGIELREDSIVEFKDGRVIVSVSQTGEERLIVDPKIVDPEKIKGEIEVKTLPAENGDELGIWTKNGIIMAVDNVDGKIKHKETSIFLRYEKGLGEGEGFGRLYTKEKSFLVYPHGRGFTNPEFAVLNNGLDGNQELDLVFDSSKVFPERNSLIMTVDEIGASSPKEGPIIKMGPGNRFGIGMKNGKSQFGEGDRTLTFQSKNGYALISRGEDGDNPLLRLKGDSVYGPDSISIIGDAQAGKFYYKPSTDIEGVSHGDGAFDLNVILINKDNEELPYVAISNDENLHVLVPETDLNNPGKFFVDEAGNAFSATVAVNQLSAQGRSELSQLYSEDRKDFIEQLETIENEGGVAGIQKAIHEKLMTSNPLRASVTLTGGGKGCSGTLVGIKGDKAYVMTAAHCLNGRGTRGQIYLNSLVDEGKSTRNIRGSGIATTVAAYDPQVDAALLEVHPTPQQMEEIKKRGFIKIPSNPNFAQGGDAVTKIGCPGARASYRVINCRINSVSNFRGIGGVRTDFGRGKKGESGGGLFKGNKYVGAYRGGNAFASLTVIQNMLDREGYGFLYQLIVGIVVVRK